MVSVCIPTYNRPQDLRHAMAAMLRQTYEDFELIIGDDASDPETRHVVESFSDPRLRYFRNAENAGIYGNWNRLIERATGEAIAIFHDHDLYLPTILERSMARLDRYPQAVFCHSAIVMIDERNQPMELITYPFPEGMTGSAMRQTLADSWYSPVTAAVAVVRRDAYERVGLYDDSSYGLGCDKEMWFQLAALGEVAYLSEPQAYIRARRQGDATARFNWKSVEGFVRMREDQIHEFYQGDPEQLQSKLAQFRLEQDRLLTPMMLRCLAMGDQKALATGWQVVEGRLLGRTRRMLKRMERVPLLARALRIAGLPLHYRSVARQEAQRRASAEASLAAKPIPWTPDALEALCL